MRKQISIVAALVLVTLSVVAGRMIKVEGQSRQDSRFAAVPTEKGGQDIFGAYEVVANWPKPISSLPGHEKWTWGAARGIRIARRQAPKRARRAEKIEGRVTTAGGAGSAGLEACQRPPGSPKGLRYRAY